MIRKGVALETVVLLFLLIFPHGAQAGKYAGEFLSEGVGARALAMGGAYVAVANDATANYWNPAGLSFLAGPEISVTHVSMFDALANFDALALSMPVGWGFGLGLSWIRLGIDDIPKYNELQGTSSDRIGQAHPEWRSTGQADGYFSDTEQAYIFSFGKRFDFDFYLGGGLTPVVLPLEFSVGASGKFLSHKLDTRTGTGQGIDLGALLRVSLTSQAEGSSARFLSLGFGIQNLGTKVAWDTVTEEGEPSNYEDKVVENLRYGLAFTQDIAAFSSTITLAALRGGADVGEFTAGAGVKMYMAKVDYAFVGYELGNSHRLSVAVNF